MTGYSTSATPIEWGPAHLRDEATAFEIELVDRPDDN